MDSAEASSKPQSPVSDYLEVDAYGVPIHVFGEPVPPEFFEILGRILAVSGKIEYLQERLGDLPPHETSGVRKVEQFLARCQSGRTDRNAVVHSRWVFGAHPTDPEAIMGLRYKRVGKQATGEIATVSIVDLPGSEREQDAVQYTLDDLRRLLRSSVATLRIGEQAYSEIMFEWASRQIAADAPSI